MKSIIPTVVMLLACSTVIAQNVGIGTTTPQARLHVADSSVVFTGAILNNVANPPVSGPGNRMMWYAPRAAFRVGGNGDGEWDKDQVGNYSFAAGYSTSASGLYSASIGQGNYAFGEASFVSGRYNIAAGNVSFASGWSTNANGYVSAAIGQGTVSNGYASLVIGHYNDAISQIETAITDSTPLFIVGNGADNNNRSNALVIEKSGKVGIGSNKPKAKLHVADGNVVFTGKNWPLTLPYANPPVSGAGARMMWYPDKAAFRVGDVETTNWDKDNIGPASFAAGDNPIASGISSVAMGKTAQATGNYSASIGENTLSSGINATAFGLGSTASGRRATVTGEGNIAAGYSSLVAGMYNDPIITAQTVAYTNSPLFIIGNGNSIASRSNVMVVKRNGAVAIGDATADLPNTIAMGSMAVAGDNNAVAIGAGTIAYGESSVAIGYSTTARGRFSTALGYDAIAYGQMATATGRSTYANGYAAFVVGMYNDSIITRQTVSSNETPLFIIGNGLGGARSNAMVVLKNGNVAIGDNGSPVNRLHITGGTDASLVSSSGYITTGAISSTNLVMDNNEIQVRLNGAASDLYFQNAGGNIGIGPTGTPAYQLEITGTAGKPGGGSWSNASDRRLKENIQPYKDGLLQLLQINPVTYHYNQTSGYDTKPRYVGIIAQELQPIAPYMVSTLKKNDTEYLSVDNSAMTYMLINAVKELSQKINELEKKLANK